MEVITLLVTTVIAICGLVIGVLQLRQGRRDLGQPQLRGSGKPRRSQFLQYEIGVLSRLYAQDSCVVVGQPYAHLAHWSISDRSAAISPFQVRVKAGKFSIRSDQPEGWRAVSDLAYAALQADGHDVLRNECLVRIVDFDPDTLTLTVQPAEYNDQRRSNLVLDFAVDGRPTLRHMLSAQYGAKLPMLSDERLANTLGVAMLVIIEEHGRLFGYCVRRPGKGVAVFQNTWSCSASGAAKWPTRDHELSFYAGLVEDMLAELEEEVGLTSADLTFFMPVALSRELVRGGKPELFFLAGTRLTRDALKARRARARRLAGATSQPQEVVADTVLRSASWFVDLAADPSTFFADDIAHQASALLTEGARQFDSISASFRSHPLRP